MPICKKITAEILVNCAEPIQGGSKDRLYLFNFDDIEDSTISRNITNNQIIEDIALPSGVLGFLFEGQNSSTLPKHTFIKGRFIGSFDHEINFKVFDLSPGSKIQLELMNGGKFVAIIENNYKGKDGNAAYEVYGLQSGLMLELMERDSANADTQGAYDVTLKSGEFKEAHLPATFFLTNYATTKVLVDALI